MKRKNILVLLIDSLRADVSVGKQKRTITPFIDTLRNSGVTYTNAFSVATSTTPAVSSIMTGLYPPVHGVAGLMGYKLNKSCHTLAEILRENGYHTYAFVTGPLLTETSLNRGFMEYHYRRNDSVYKSFGEQLSSRLKTMQEPWFCFVHFWEVHTPRQVPFVLNHSDGLTIYEKAVSCLDMWLKENLLNKIDFEDTIVILTADHGEKDSPLNDKLIVSKNFRRLDRFFHIKRRFMNFRKKYFINNKKGFLWFNHGYHLYEPLIKIPLIIVAKDKLIKASIRGGIVSQVDIFPTILELVDIKYPFDINGTSIVNEKMQEERGMYLEASNLEANREGSFWLKGVRTPSWKYIVSAYNKHADGELFNLKEDPAESKNLVHKELAIKEKMGKLLKEIEHEMEDLKRDFSSENKMSEEEVKTMEKVLKELGYL